jgi:hypothetical protein
MTIKYKSIRYSSINDRHINRYKGYAIGSYKIKTIFGDININTGDELQEFKGSLGTLYNVKDHSLRILNNEIKEIESIDLWFNNFVIYCKGDFNINGKIFKIENIVFENDKLYFYIVEFPNEILLKDNTIIKLINEEEDKILKRLPIIELFNNHINIRVSNPYFIDNRMYENKVYNYFYTTNNNITNKYTNIIIDENWENIINGYLEVKYILK